MPAVPPLLGLAKWPLTLAGAVVVFGISSQGTLGLISEHVRPSVTRVTAPIPAIIKMPAPVAATVRQVDTRLSVLSGGRSISGSVTALSDADVFSLPTMQVNTPGLVVRSHPLKGSSQVGTLKQGETVEVRSKQGGWMLISSPSGTVGWVFGKYLALKPASTWVIVLGYHALGDRTGRARSTPNSYRTPTYTHARRGFLTSKYRDDFAEPWLGTVPDQDPLVRQRRWSFHERK